MRPAIPEWISSAVGLPRQGISISMENVNRWLPGSCLPAGEKHNAAGMCVQALCQWWDQPVRSKALVTVLIPNKYKQIQAEEKSDITH